MEPDISHLVQPVCAHLAENTIKKWETKWKGHVCMSVNFKSAHLPRQAYVHSSGPLCFMGKRRDFRGKV